MRCVYLPTYQRGHICFWKQFYIIIMCVWYENDTKNIRQFFFLQIIGQAYNENLKMAQYK